MHNAEKFVLAELENRIAGEEYFAGKPGWLFLNRWWHIDRCGLDKLRKALSSREMAEPIK